MKRGKDGRLVGSAFILPPSSFILIQMPPRQQNKHPAAGAKFVPRAGVHLPDRTPHSYRAEFSRSVINWSLVVITRLAAEKPVEEMIRFTNSFDRSTLLCSSEPARTAPAPSSSGAEMIGTPLLPAATYWLPPRSISPSLFENVAIASWPSVRVCPLL